MNCYQCGAQIDDTDRAAVLCATCHAAAKAAMDARLAMAGEIGGQSSPPEYEADTNIRSLPAKGQYTGTGRDAGGGHRVIRKIEPLGG